MEGEARLTTALLDAADIGCLVWQLVDEHDDSSLTLAFANAAAARALQMPIDAMLGRRIFDAFPTANVVRARKYAQLCRDQEAHDFGVFRHLDAAGVTTTFMLSARPVSNGSIAVLFENLTAARRAEVEAERLSHFLDSLIEHMPVMVFVKDAATLRFERFNRAGEELIGISRDDLLGKSDADLFPPEQADFFVSKDREVLARGTLEDIPEEPIQTARGQRWLHTRKIPLRDENGEPRHLIGVSIDITARKLADDALREAHASLQRDVTEQKSELEQQVGERLRAERALASVEEQLRQAQRMEAVGRLAGGVAHDFNNMLTVILSYTSLSLARLRPDDPLRVEMTEVLHAAERATGLTQQLLALSRRQVLAPRVVDLNDTVQRLQQMLRRLIGEDVELSTIPAADLHRVRVDVSQLEQVILNLVVNARDAMPKGGRITIETRNVELDPRFASEHLELSPGPYVLLSVSDTGVGMDRETQARIFEPFFTTKEPGKGTGLGLSTVFGIVKQSGGHIFVRSELQKGTSFRIFLPSAGDATVEQPLHATLPAPRDGGETILVVEDDEPVRRVFVGILRRSGYRVIDASGPLSALSIAEGTGESIDLLLTDVVMPDMSGPELARRIRKLRPRLRVLCASGYADDAVLQHGILQAGMAYLQKPITPDMLLRKIRETLDAVRE